MSVPLSSAPRSSNLTVPATQNTAPVIRFRCLYTHDTRRKAKRWQDGFLRYHTFNKRVMVYDNSGYFIGDLHWRQDEGIQDGDELELDKGVLIQVCEPMERTETDVSSLYNKIKSQGPPSRWGDPPTPSVRLTAPVGSFIASQKPTRSLKDLLGINKSSTGQSLSPYEESQRQKQASDSLQNYERPAKRQRTASPEYATRPSRPKPAVIDLSHSPPQEESPPKHLSVPSRSATTSSNSMPANTARSKNPSLPHNPPRNPWTSLPKSPLVNPDPEASVNTLRLSTEKPRRKLVYQELLLSQGSTNASSEATSPPLQEYSQGCEANKHIDKPDATSDPTMFIYNESEDYLMQGLFPDHPNKQKIPSSANISGGVVNTTLGPADSPRINVTIERRRQSHKDAPGPELIPPNLPTATKLTLPKPSTPSIVTSNPATDGKLPAKPRSVGLRKSYSDPSNINSLPTRSLSSSTSPLNPSMGQSTAHEQGPWTSDALDLFDFWPPGRPKPG